MKQMIPCEIVTWILKTTSNRLLVVARANNEWRFVLLSKNINYCKKSPVHMQLTSAGTASKNTINPPRHLHSLESSPTQCGTTSKTAFNPPRHLHSLESSPTQTRKQEHSLQTSPTQHLSTHRVNQVLLLRLAPFRCVAQGLKQHDNAPDVY
mmetsp:Transcript_17285/g.29582  ORF Transcript_17285/g.29582 Transcript_17285/m.29582 type:complete len:152 (-) Transcript_17285:2613-3068(-)